MNSYEDVLRTIGRRARQLRVFHNLTQGELATRAGISSLTVQRFEHTGRSAIESVLRIATVLRAEEGFEKLFEPPKYRSLDEALAEPAVERRRVRKRRRP